MSSSNEKNIDNQIDSELFPIRKLAEMTGVGTSTLRAWERRYGLLAPLRSPKGHRLYNNTHVDCVNKIKDLLEDGHSFSNIKHLLVDEASIQADTGLSVPETWQNTIYASLEATRDFNIERLDNIYNEALSLYPVDLVIENLVLPTLEIIGTAWQVRPEVGIAEEHFYTNWLKNRIGARFHHAYQSARGNRMICACMPGSFHEIGLMLFALSALSKGYRVLYLGADLPLEQLLQASNRAAAKAIVLSTETDVPQSAADTLAEITASTKTPVFVGGPYNEVSASRLEQSHCRLLGSNIAVGLRVLNSYIPAYS